MIDQTDQTEPEEEEDNIPGLPDPVELARLQRAMEAQQACRDNGGDPAAIDALAMLRSSVVEGITLYANPPATYCALQLLKGFWPASPLTAAPDEIEMDQLIAMVYAFAQPVPAYLAARRGQEGFFSEALHWANENFTGPDMSYRLGRAAGWCMGILQTLEALNPQRPVTPLIPEALPAVPPDPTPDSSPP